MKNDLDRLMQERELVAVLILGSEQYSSVLDYLVGNVKITGGLAIKKPGARPLLVVNPMEIEEAKASPNADAISYNALGWSQLVADAGGNRQIAQAVLTAHALEYAGVDAGRVGVYGNGNHEFGLGLADLLRDQYPEYRLVGELGVTLFEEAAATKDANEIARIKAVATRTNAVLEATWDFISSHRADGDGVVNSAGEALTIGGVKRFVRRALLEHDLEEDGMIFAQGRDAGFPHSRGQEDMPLKLGQSIIFDLFPRELGGGYYHDTTRTWCIGHAPANVQQAYEQVHDAYDVAIEAFGVGKPTHIMQDAVQDFLEASGHATLRSHPGTEVGYVHSLGHGLGLQVHEAPSINHINHAPTFVNGQVITIEPGLYYPEEGYGVRYENTLYIDENGALITLTDFRDDLVLPLNGTANV